LRDRVRGRTILLAPTWGYNASISADGRYVVLSTMAGLVPQDQNGMEDIYRYEIATGTWTPISVSSAGVFANWDSDDPAISRDGRFVSFESYASNLAPNTGPGWRRWTNIFIRDVVTGTTRVVSVDSAGVESNSNSFSSDVSDDGRYVVFKSDANNLVAGDGQGTWDIFVHDMADGETIRVSNLTGLVGGLRRTGDHLAPGGHERPGPRRIQGAQAVTDRPSSQGGGPQPARLLRRSESTHAIWARSLRRRDDHPLRSGRSRDDPVHDAFRGSVDRRTNREDRVEARRTGCEHPGNA
jgi:hypothetical protein